MNQPVLTDLFAVEVEAIPAVPHAPIAPSASPIAKHCSSMGALKAEETREVVWRRMLRLYRFGPHTDADIVAAFLIEGIEIACSTISARRAELIKMGKVEDAKASRKNPRTGISNSLWQLVKK